VGRPVSLAGAATGQARVVALQCRISETAPYARGVQPLAAALASRLGVEPRLIGTKSAARAKEAAPDSLSQGRGCLLEAGGQVDDALADGRFPLLLHGDCAIAMTTLAAVARHRPDARVLWLDAHGDFNTPETTPSGWLGGMALAAACGRWDAGLGVAGFPSQRVVLCGVRDLDPGERDLLERSSVTVIGAALETLVYLQNALDGAPVYIHLDPDVLDPSTFPSEYEVPDGLSPDKLYDLLDAVADASEVVGLEIAAYYAPDDPAERGRFAELLAEAVAPVLPSPTPDD
jgi:arginase family enzyme